MFRCKNNYNLCFEIILNNEAILLESFIQVLVLHTNVFIQNFWQYHKVIYWCLTCLSTMGSDSYYLFLFSSPWQQVWALCRPESGKPRALLQILFPLHPRGEPIGYHRKRKIKKEGRHFEKWNAHRTWHYIFQMSLCRWKPTLNKVLSNYTKTFGAGL